MRSVVTLKFQCPRTKGELEYRLQADAKVLVARWSKNLRCKCPYCKSLHRFQFREGYVDGVIAQFGRADAGARAFTEFIAR